MLRVLLVILFVCWFSFPVFSKQPQTNYMFNIQKLSYFELDYNGALVKDEMRSRDGEIYYKVNDKIYEFSKEFSNVDTAVVVMDAWVDSGTDFLNQQFMPIFYETTFPLIQAFSEKEFKIYAFTNMDTDAAYGEDLFPELEAMVSGGLVKKKYHKLGDAEEFQNELRQSGVKNIIYLGFASNMCVIGRRVGMFGMLQMGFKTYFVPESSAAVETQQGWKTREFHKYTISLIQHNFSGTISNQTILEAFLGH